MSRINGVPTVPVHRVLPSKDEDSNALETPVPPRVRRAANWTIAGMALASATVGLGAHLIGRTGVYTTIPVGIGLVLCACLWLPDTLKVSVALSCFAAMFVLYAAELYFTFIVAPGSIGRFSGVSAKFDSRPALQVVHDLRQHGQQAHANLAARVVMAYGRDALASSAGPLLPLGGMSRQLVVFCNESGEYVSYQSDEHGFDNPAGVWSQAPIAVAALGDSFVQGYCVASDDNFVSLIRQRYPATLNLGGMGEGPLLEFATLQEYVSSRKPRLVLWFYFEANDLEDLGDERRNPVLRRYLEEDSFRQDLLDRQPEIDRAWGGFEGELMNSWERSRPVRLLRPMTDWLTDLSMEHKNRSVTARIIRLREVRQRLGTRLEGERQEDAQLPLLEEILGRANAEVHSWGGSLYFVFLPGMDLLMRPNGPRAELARQVLDRVNRLDIPVIDVRPTFQSREIASLFRYPDSHYNEVGAALVAQAVLDGLRRENPPERKPEAPRQRAGR